MLNGRWKRRVVVAGLSNKTQVTAIFAGVHILVSVTISTLTMYCNIVQYTVSECQLLEKKWNLHMHWQTTFSCILQKNDSAQSP